MRPAPRKFLTQRQVIERVGLSRTSIFTMARAGRFPRGHKIGAKSIRWLESDIDGFMQSVVSDRPWSPEDKAAGVATLQRAP
jgi:prophage regulatory protein